jgi:SAM-dependent methyltransferase
MKFKYQKPVIVDNKNLRKKYPVINKYFSSSLDESNWFPKINNVVKSKKIVSFIDCPVCKSKSKNTIFVLQGFIHSNCNKCSHIYISNPLKEKILLNFYKSTKAYKLYINTRQTRYLKKYNNLLYRKYYNLYKNFLFKNAKILEIGCGTGQFLKFLVNKGHKPYASEFIGVSKKIIPSIIGKKNFFFQMSTSNLPFKNCIDFIFLWGVLEHLRYPLEEMKIFNKNLKMGGKIFFLIPNLKSRAFELLGMKTPTITPKNHLNFFSHKSFALLCKKSGFRVINSNQELPIIDLMYDFIDNYKNELKKILKNDLSYYRTYLIQKVS